jgi:hypothetical protein
MSNQLKTTNPNHIKEINEDLIKMLEELGISFEDLDPEMLQAMMELSLDEFITYYYSKIETAAGENGSYNQSSDDNLDNKNNQDVNRSNYQFVDVEPQFDNTLGDQLSFIEAQDNEKTEVLVQTNLLINQATFAALENQDSPQSKEGVKDPSMNSGETENPTLSEPTQSVNLPISKPVTPPSSGPVTEPTPPTVEEPTQPPVTVPVPPVAGPLTPTPSPPPTTEDTYDPNDRAEFLSGLTEAQKKEIGLPEHLRGNQYLEPEIIDPDGNFISAAGTSKIKLVEGGLDMSLVDDIQVNHDMTTANVTVDPDGTISIVSYDSQYDGSHDIDVVIKNKDGSVSTEKVNVTFEKSDFLYNFGRGDHYTLQEDANSRYVIETGENHHKLHVTGGSHGLTLEDFAKLEGVDVETLGHRYYRDNIARIEDTYYKEGYEFSEEMANILWSYSVNEKNSNWVLFEKGYEYEDMNLYFHVMRGESDINPIYISSYGDGADPIMGGRIMTGTGRKPYEDNDLNVVIEGLTLNNGVSFTGNFDNIIMENITSYGTISNKNGVENQTFRMSSILDVHKVIPPSAEYTSKSGFRKSGAFTRDSEGFLYEHNYNDLSGWQVEALENPGKYDPGDIFSHGYYFSVDTLDLTFRDNVTTRPSSFGVKSVTGAYMENNVFIDGNAGFFTIGGKESQTRDPDGRLQMNNSFISDNIVTQGAHKPFYKGNVGARAFGFQSNLGEAIVLDNIIMHRLDPNDPIQIAQNKDMAGVRANNKMFEHPLDNTIIYNWDFDKRPDGAEFKYNNTIKNSEVAADLDQITIQNYTKMILDNPDAELTDLFEFLRTRGKENWDDIPGAQEIADYFQEAVGLDISKRLSAQDITFVPFQGAGGIRWDNKENWSTGDVAGTIFGDSVNLNGNWVNYGGTHYLTNLDFGQGGKLDVGQGYLEVMNNLETHDRGSELTVRDSGQFWVNGFSDDDLLDITVTGGRFANTGLFDGHYRLTVSGNSQTILASDDSKFVVDGEDYIKIGFKRSKVGFDGQNGGDAVLELKEGATLEFSLDTEKVSTIREFKSGHFGDAPNVNSIVDLGQANTTLKIDLSEGTFEDGIYQYDLVNDIDNLLGRFGQIDIAGNDNVSGVNTVYNYETDQLSVTIAFNDSSLVGLSTDIYGSGDSDVFFMDDDLGVVETIHDFDASEDRLDFKTILSDFDPLADKISDFVSISRNGNDATISVNKNGTGNNFVDIATLKNSSNLIKGETASLDELIQFETNNIIVV